MAELTLQQMEQAFDLISKAWESPNPQALVQIPPELQHLSPNDWENLCVILLHLQQQQESNPLQ